MGSYDLKEVIEIMRVYGSFKEQVFAYREWLKKPKESFHSVYPWMEPLKMSAKAAMQTLPIEVTQHIDKFNADLEFLVKEGIITSE